MDLTPTYNCRFVKNIILIICILFFSSCYKIPSTQTSPDFFVGRWTWNYSIVFKYSEALDAYEIKDTIFPQNTSEIIVKKNGTIKIYEDGIKMTSIDKDVIGYQEYPNSINYSTPDPTTSYMNGKFSMIRIYSYFQSDTIVVHGYPYNKSGNSYFNELAQQNSNISGIIIYNYFKRK